MDTTTARAHSARLAGLLRAEQASLADFLLALAAFDRARGWLELGYVTLHAYLVRELGLSNGAAHQRRVAAELLQRLPEVAAPLRDGRLCLSTVFEVAKVVTPENQAEVLPRFFHRSAREAREVTAALQPHPAPPMRELVRAVAPRAPEVRSALTSERAETESLLEPAPAVMVPAAATPPAPREPAPASVSAPPPPEAPARPTVTPLTADLRRFTVTVSRRFLSKLEQARHGRAHVASRAGAEEVLEAALDLLLEQQARRRGHARRRKSATPPELSGAKEARAADEAQARPGPAPAPDAAAPAYVPAAVRDEVWTRDGGGCQWPTADGCVCGSTWLVELDHILPTARGGPSTPSNLRVLCRHHNHLAARELFGDAWMDGFTRGGRRAG
jgi:hypothetical protein